MDSAWEQLHAHTAYPLALPRIKAVEAGVGNKEPLESNMPGLIGSR